MYHMRTTVDLSEDLYRKAKAISALQGVSLKQLITRAVAREIENYPITAEHNRIEFPLVRSSRPGSAKITPELIAKLLETEDLNVSS